MPFRIDLFLQEKHYMLQINHDFILKATIFKSITNIVLLSLF